MSVIAQRASEPPAGISGRTRAWAIAVIVIATALAATLSGLGSRTIEPPAASVIRDGVPVGVLHSRAGALVAAGDYLLVDQQTLERDPTRYAALVRDAFAPSIQAQALAQAARVRTADPAGMRLWASGGRSVTLIGAHRLDAYRGDRASVSCWVATVYWGAGQVPKQAWSLVRLMLRWRDGRWWLSGLVSDRGASAPVPARTPQATPGDDTTRAFDRLLAGFSPVGAGAPAP